MNIRDYDPAAGQAFQGDVAIIPIPPDITIDTTQPTAPVNGRLILQEGEVSGHHHAITLLERPIADVPVPPRRTSKGAERLMGDALANKIAVPTARLFRDPAAVEALRRAGDLTRTDLAIGILIIEHGPMVLTHEEHDGIRLPHAWIDAAGRSRAGIYYIGRQIESAGAEERRVAD